MRVCVSREFAGACNRMRGTSTGASSLLLAIVLHEHKKTWARLNARPALTITAFWIDFILCDGTKGKIHQSKIGEKMLTS